MPAIPASTVVTNLLGEPLKLAGVQAFAAGETRTIDLSAFGTAQKTVVWNGLYNAGQRGLMLGVDLTFGVTDLATGHQGVQNIGGHGTGIIVTSVPGGLSLPASVVITSLISETISIAGITILPLGVFTLDTTLLPINQQAAVWNALIRARDTGLISSPQLTVAVVDGFTGHQGVDGFGGHGPGGQLAYLVLGAAAAPVNVVAPVVSGPLGIGSTLSCTTGTWTGSPPPTFTYQWQNNGSDLVGETASTYVTVSTDDGDLIRCVVTATNTEGSASANSNAVVPTSAYTPSLDFSDARNSQYLVLLFDDLA